MGTTAHLNFVEITLESRLSLEHALPYAYLEPGLNPLKDLGCTRRKLPRLGSLVINQIVLLSPNTIFRKQALSVADTSIIFEDEKKFVYKILDNNKIKKTEVMTGIRKAGNLEILDGLNANDKIVKEGLARLADGMPVKPLIK